MYGFIHLNTLLPEEGRDIKMLVNQDSDTTEDQKEDYPL